MTRRQKIMKMVGPSSLMLFLVFATDAAQAFAATSKNTAFITTVTRKIDAFPSSTVLHSMNSSPKKTTSNAFASRKDFLQTSGLAGMASASVFFSPLMDAAAFAEDNDEGGSNVSVILQSPNLRSLKRAEKQLSKMELYAVENDYEAMKLALRNAPFSEVRKNSFSLIKEFADRPEQQEKLTASYATFIASLEKMDSTASLGMRGRKLEKGALLQSFDAVKSSMSDWISVCEGML